jgi:hypothetical protein
MSVEHLQYLARKHWEEWVPEKVAELRKEGRLSEALRGAALLERDEIDHLRSIGYRQHEAEEVALKHFILLDPEPGAGHPDWELEELAEAEREYQSNVVPYLWSGDEVEGT